MKALPGTQEEFNSNVCLFDPLMLRVFSSSSMLAILAASSHLPINELALIFSHF